MAKKVKVKEKDKIYTMYHGKPIDLLVDNEDEAFYYCSFSVESKHPVGMSGNYTTSIDKKFVTDDKIIRGDIYSNASITVSKLTSE